MKLPEIKDVYFRAGEYIIPFTAYRTENGQKISYTDWQVIEFSTIESWLKSGSIEVHIRKI